MAKSITTMTKQAEPSTPRFDGVKWVVAIVLLAASIAANYWLRNSVAVAVLAIGWVVLACILAGLIATTKQGKQAIEFMKQARIELRKVVWPTRQETIQTTMIVIAIVVIVALFLWGADTLIMWLVGLITGQRG